MAPKPLMTQTEYAAYRGVGVSAVSNWKRDNKIVFAPDPDRPGKQLVDVVKTDAVLGATVDPTRGRPSSGGGVAPTQGLGTGVDNVRLALVREQTTKHKLANAKAAGELISLADAEAMAAQFARLSRERMHGLIRQQGERLAAETDTRSITAFMTAEIDAVFDGLASDADGYADALAAEASAETIADADEEPAEDEAAA